MVVDQWRPYLQHGEFIILIGEESIITWRSNA